MSFESAAQILRISATTAVTVKAVRVMNRCTVCVDHNLRLAAETVGHAVGPTMSCVETMKDSRSVHRGASLARVGTAWSVADHTQ